MRNGDIVLFLDILLIIAMVLLTQSCTVSQWYPVGGAVVGGASGSILGPVGGGIGAGVGYAGGKTAQMMTENEDLKETVDALTHGDVSKLVEKGLESQQSGFQEFTGTIKNILTVAGSVLLAYLCIPILLARRSAQKEVQKCVTRAPFPVRPPRHDNNEKL
jgi:hypothetical protein